MSVPGTLSPPGACAEEHVILGEVDLEVAHSPRTVGHVC